MAKSSCVRMKLLIDTQAKRVLYAEASKDCVDFLFVMLSLPIATVVRLLKNQGIGGSLANLYKSIERLDESYLQPNQRKDTLLQPPLSQPIAPLLLLKDSPSTETKFYTCGPPKHQFTFEPVERIPESAFAGTHHYCVSDDPQATCPSCCNKMTTALTYVPPRKRRGSSSEGGFVKGLVTYMVMDNLEIDPISTISTIVLLNRFKVKDVGSLEERVVDLGMDEAIRLLKASMQSDTVLTDVFLKG